MGGGEGVERLNLTGKCLNNHQFEADETYLFVLSIIKICKKTLISP